MGTVLVILCIAVIILFFYSRNTSKQLNEDIDEIRATLFELRTSIKSLKSDWNRKYAEILVRMLKYHKEIPEKRKPYYITNDCIACASCTPECPVDAIIEGDIFEIKPELCTGCGKCAEVCPVNACIPLEIVIRKKTTQKKTDPKA